jgi:hypothetical protein
VESPLPLNDTSLAYYSEKKKFGIVMEIMTKLHKFKHTDPELYYYTSGTLYGLHGTIATLNGTLYGLHGTIGTKNGTLNGLHGTVGTENGTIGTENGTLNGLHGTIRTENGWNALVAI